MLKNKRSIAWLGLCGFLIGAALYVYSSLFDYTKPLTTFDTLVGLVSFILCPPSLLLALCIDCEVGGVSGMVTFSLVALLNAALYYIIGLVVLRLQRSSG
jgi:hypothetical protein